MVYKYIYASDFIKELEFDYVEIYSFQRGKKHRDFEKELKNK